MHKLFSLLTTPYRILTHPLNRAAKFQALSHYIRWQVGSRLAPGDILVHFIDELRLVARPGLTGITGNIYFGLQELEHMAFVLHALKPEDVFFDVGANCGSYAVLAAGACGARVVAFEPVPDSFLLLSDNVRINGLGSLVTAENIAISSKREHLRFTRHLGPVNHVLATNEPSKAEVVVEAETLDAFARTIPPTFLKVDVEGYESEVLSGATETLYSPSLLAAIVELNGSGHRYGFDDRQVDRLFKEAGFELCTYEPFQRRLERCSYVNTDNKLYVRNLPIIQERLATATRRTIRGCQI